MRSDVLGRGVSDRFFIERPLMPSLPPSLLQLLALLFELAALLVVLFRGRAVAHRQGALRIKERLVAPRLSRSKIWRPPYTRDEVIGSCERPVRAKDVKPSQVGSRASNDVHRVVIQVERRRHRLNVGVEAAQEFVGRHAHMARSRLGRGGRSA